MRLCNISLNKDTKITLDDISGTGIFQTKKYIEKVLLIDLKHINKEWSELIKLNQLRNHFVHTSNNKLKKEETKKRINNIRGIKGLELIDMDEYFIINFKNDEFIRSFIKTIKNLLIKIYYEDYNKFSF